MTTRTAAATILLASGLVLMMTGCDPIPAPTSTPTGSVSASPSAVEETPIAEEPDGLSESDLQNISDAINSGNTAALEGYMADSVNVIYAATECCGPQTPVEAIGSLDYLGDATGPWTFPTDEATVDIYRTGFYVDYFPAGAYVGHSADADPFVISFTITGGKITTIFISAAESLLFP